MVYDAPIRVVNASLPFADPIAPGFTTLGGVYRPWAVRSYREFDRRKRILDALTREAQRLGLYEHDF